MYTWGRQSTFVLQQTGLCQSVWGLSSWAYKGICFLPPDNDLTQLICSAGCLEGTKRRRSDIATESNAHKSHPGQTRVWPWPWGDGPPVGPFMHFRRNLLVLNYLRFLFSKGCWLSIQDLKKTNYPDTSFDKWLRPSTLAEISCSSPHYIILFHVLMSLQALVMSNTYYRESSSLNWPSPSQFNNPNALNWLISISNAVVTAFGHFLCNSLNGSHVIILGCQM